MRSWKLACCLIVMAAATSAAAQQPRYLQLNLFTTNDLHSNMVPVNYDASLEGKIPGSKGVGGMARIATVIRQARAQMRTPVLYLDSGDTTYGNNALARTYHGGDTVAILNALGCTAMEPGNHDFQWPAADSLRNLRDSFFPWVSANLIDEKTGKPFLAPYVIRDVWGVRVAFFGLITQLVNSEPYKAARELKLKAVPGIEVAKTLVPELRQKADIVICLSHMGVKLDQDLATQVPGIDVILGGHSHSRLPQPKLPRSSEATAFSLGVVPVVQAFCWGGELGKTEVIFRKDPATGRYSLMSCHGELVPINSSIPDDPQIAAMIRQFHKGIKPAPMAKAK